MILYHYSVDSYKGGSTLLNDYKQQARLAEPFLLALQTSTECFWSVYYSAMAYTRELCALGLRKHENYIKDAVEAIFESIRREKFSTCSVSRIGCVYYCESEAEARAYLLDDCIASGDFTYEQVCLLAVEVEDSRISRYDQTYFNQAMEIMEQKRDIQAVTALTEAYFSQERSPEPVIEVLSDGENRILRALPLR